MRQTPPPNKREIKAAKSAVITINSRWATANLAAQLFGCTKRQLSDWKDKGFITFSKPTGEKGTIFYDIESINRFINQHKII